MVLLDDIDNFIQEKITFADKQIARTAQSRVDSGDVILTYAYSSAVLSAFLLAKQVWNMLQHGSFGTAGVWELFTPLCLIAEEIPHSLQPSRSRMRPFLEKLRLGYDTSGRGFKGFLLG